ncbi:hypothetical protein AGMMS49959_12410 [Planctomycetales bacterium]|nr:hypothetical protein AGMMS49959_12410 [Planctomycetales bacterium]
MRRICGLLALTLGLGAAGGGETSARQVTVANVGNGKVTLDAVLELWYPSWSEIIAKGRGGKISGGAVNAQLQAEWTKDVEAVIRDELFYQEAMNDFERAFQQNVDLLYAQMRAQQSGGTRADAERRLKGIIDKSREQQIASIINHNLKAAGGIDNLSRVLVARGLMFDEWKNRLVRKAYTYSYLANLFEPLGKVVQPSPKEVRRYYEAHPDEFSEPGDVVFQQLLLRNDRHGGEDKTYELAEQIYRDLEDGKLTFAQAVRQYSDDAESQGRDGRETTVAADPEREAWLSEVRAAAADQQPNELGPILVSPRGCHLARLIRADPPKIIPYSRAQKTILDKMEQNKWESKSNELYQKIKNKTLVQIALPDFPPEYRWENSSGNRVRHIGFGGK